MNGPLLFENFVTNIANIGTIRARNELYTFADTFAALLATTDQEISDFVKNTHSTNSARAANARILIPTGSVIVLQAILFELKDRKRCNALPTATMMSSLNAIQVTEMRGQRTQAIHDIEQNKLASLPAMEIPKLIAHNYETFSTAFVALTARTMGTNGTTLEYLTRTTDGNYDAEWLSREEKLKNCTRLTGPHFQKDSHSLYSLFVQHVGSEGVGSNIVNRFKAAKNGYRCYHEFEAHFKNDAYLENKASAATQAMEGASYKGDRRNFTIESYYIIMANGFNDLAQAGPAHLLNEQQKVTKFENGLKDTTAISWAITAKNHWNNLPVPDQTFDRFYNEFSKFMTKFKTLSTPDTRSSRIASFGTEGRGGRGGRGRGRGRGRSNRNGRGGRYGRGNRGGRTLQQ